MTHFPFRKKEKKILKRRIKVSEDGLRFRGSFTVAVTGCQLWCGSEHWYLL